MANKTNGGFHFGVPIGLPVPGIYQAGRPRLIERIESVALTVSVTLGIIIGIQLLYPTNATLPRSSYAGQPVGFMNSQQIQTKIGTLNTNPMLISAKDKSYRVSLADMGLAADTEAIARELADYPVKRRLIPFSLLLQKRTARDARITIADQTKLDTFIAQVAKDNNKDPVEGSIVMKNGEAIIQRSSFGVRYEAEAVRSYFSAADQTVFKEGVALPYTSIAPVNTNDYLEKLIASTNEAALSGHKVMHGTNTVIIEPSVVRQAAQYITDPKTKKVTKQYNPMILASGLETLADTSFVAPSASAHGQELDAIATSQTIAQNLIEGGASSKAVIRTLEPTEKKLYAATSKGLQQLIDEWVAKRPGYDMAVDFTEMDGMGRKASSRPNEKYFSASVYKAITAAAYLTELDKGKVNPNAIITNGWNLDQCLEQMIVISESRCAETMVYKLGGWRAMDEFAAGHGVEGITLSSGLTVTPRGMTQFLTKLENREILSESSTQKLLAVMKRQKYRGAIPAGSAGEVADKVGYNPRAYSWHDAAIVYHPKTKYTLVIMTRTGASLPALSDLARQISGTLNR